MKKLLLTTAATAMMSTAAIATVTIDTSSNDYIVGRIHKGVQIANHFDARDINIVENGQGQIRVSQTVNAWEEAWDEAETDNSIDLGPRISQTYLWLENGDFVITGTEDPRFNYSLETIEPIDPIYADNAIIDIYNGTATYTNNDGVEVVNADINYEFTQTASAVDVRAQLIYLNDQHKTAPDELGQVDIEIGESSVGLSIYEGWSFEENSRLVKRVLVETYDAGFEDGFTAGYNEGFAAAKAVVTNGD